ncbi:MAG: capsular polysaccharide biosynthesis protein [Crocinitomicaceae bacterium]
MFGRLFGRSRPKLPPADLSVLKADMHSHLIPGIDDGSKNMDQTIAMLAKFESLGYKKVVTTPHIMSDYFKNTPEIILGGLKKVQETAKTLGLKIEIEAAAEYYFDDAFVKQLQNKESLLTFGDRFLLFEFSFHEAPNQTEAMVFEMVTQKYQPVLAHFERYTYYLGSVEKAREFRERGVHIQVNINSLAGHYGPAIKKQAELLIDEKLVDFIASDCHRIEHLMILERAATLPYLHKALELPLKNHLLV